MATGMPVQVYEPYTYKLPPLGQYCRDLWKRRKFAYHMARATLKGRNFETVFGQLWLVINPVLLALVYYLLTTVLEAQASSTSAIERFTSILSGLFAFYYTRNVIQLASTSITGGGKMIMNMSFPKALLPLSSLFSAALMYFPTLIVYGIAHILAGRPVNRTILWLIPIFVIQTVFSFGAGMFFAAMSVYFRDTASFLPYALRIWIYLSPVIYTVEKAKSALGNMSWVVTYNPLTPILADWNSVLKTGKTPDLAYIWQGTGWAVGVLLVGCLFFMSREREFAFRI